MKLDDFSFPTKVSRSIIQKTVVLVSPLDYALMGKVSELIYDEDKRNLAKCKIYGPLQRHNFHIGLQTWDFYCPTRFF